MKPIRDLHIACACQFCFSCPRLIAVKPTLPDWVRDPRHPHPYQFIVIVLNEMVLVLVIESPTQSITSASTVLRTENEHEKQRIWDFDA